ncbi:MAG TPA: acyltransferase [Caulobacteraceae bacterium]|jgi:peptidoglycan/LPS O-acetylase OafA/YrhL|nr:acyltransferase [Caulobacteraceae bacterium]
MTDDKAMHGYVRGLDGIRAVCISVVVLGHIGFGDLVPGGLGVTTFFFLSGYLITGLLAAEHDRFGRVDFARFYGRRTLRLLPELAVFVGLLGLVIAPLLGQPLPLGAALAALFYWTNYYMVLGFDTCRDCSITGHLWSLSVEEHFYLVMPVAMAACAFAPRRLGQLLLAVIIVGLGWRVYADAVLHMPEIYTYKTTECRMDSIAWGCLAAVVQRAQPGLMQTVRRRGAAVFAAGLALLLASLLIRDEGFRNAWRYSLQGLALMGLILPLVVGAPRLEWVTAILEWAPLRWMGRRSYGAYLWHYAALTFAGLMLGVKGPLETASLHDRLSAIAPTLVMTWTFAAISYALVFQPSQKLKPLLAPRAPAPRNIVGAALAGSAEP